MTEVTIRDLAGFGLPLVAQDDPSFPVLAAESESRPAAERLQPSDKDGGAVLLNNTGRAIIWVEWLWRYTGHGGKPRISRFSNLTSSAQWDVLSGRSKVWRDAATFILPGSKRLLTERGMFGDNLDVLTPEEMPRSQGYCGCGWAGGRFHSGEEP
jgi:hypothetical protein